MPEDTNEDVKKQAHLIIYDLAEAIIEYGIPSFQGMEADHHRISQLLARIATLEEPTVCEWSVMSNTHFWKYNTQCTHIAFRAGDLACGSLWMYCPFCGCKIKDVSPPRYK